MVKLVEAALLALLLKVEWSKPHKDYETGVTKMNCCPVCHAGEYRGHETGCELAALKAVLE